MASVSRETDTAATDATDATDATFKIGVCPETRDTDATDAIRHAGDKRTA